MEVIKFNSLMANMPTKPEMRTIPIASGQSSASVHLHIRTNIIARLNSNPTQGIKQKTDGIIFAKEDIAAMPSIATNVPSTLVIFIPIQRQTAEKKVPIANPDKIAVNKSPEEGLALRVVVALPDKEVKT